MTKKAIDFKQERDFGDLFNATFSFISQEFKRLATAILYFVAPFFLFAAIALTVFSIKSQEMMQSVAQTQTGKPDPFAIFSVMGSLSGYLTFAMVIGVMAYSMLFSTVYGYIKLYVQNGSEGFTMNDVWGQSTKYFLNFMVATFLIGLVVMVGFVFCLLPGIYFGVALCIVPSIMIFEEVSFLPAFRRSMKLINKNWWQTFAVMIVTTIIIYVLMFFISIPDFLYGFKTVFANIKSGQSITTDLPISYYVINTITQLFTQMLMVIPVVITAFIYYSTVEKVEKPSLMEKIAQINDNE